jgi:hypothetical protein
MFYAVNTKPESFRPDARAQLEQTHCHVSSCFASVHKTSPSKKFCIYYYKLSRKKRQIYILIGSGFERKKPAISIRFTTKRQFATIFAFSLNKKIPARKPHGGYDFL